MSRLASSEADTLDEESWAELVARSLSSSRAAIDLTDSYLFDFVGQLSERTSLRNAAWAGSTRRGGPPSECTPSPAFLSHGIQAGRPLTSRCAVVLPDGEERLEDRRPSRGRTQLEAGAR